MSSCAYSVTPNNGLMSTLVLPVDAYMHCVVASLRLQFATFFSASRPCARGARQGHLLDEGEVTPGVARPVHAARDSVRPRCRCRLRLWPRRCRTAVRAAPAPGGGPRQAGGASRSVAACCGGCWGRPGLRAVGVGRDRSARPHDGAQGRVQHRARGAAGGGRVAQPEDIVRARTAQHCERGSGCCARHRDARGLAASRFKR